MPLPLVCSVMHVAVVSAGTLRDRDIGFLFPVAPPIGEPCVFRRVENRLRSHSQISARDQMFGR
jgi:hypothetical protein